MPKKKKMTSPVVKRPAFKVPPKELGEHRGLNQRLEAVVGETVLTLKAAPREHHMRKEDPNGKENISDYKKQLFMKNTLGWYYYLPAFMRPKLRLSAAVAAVEHDDEDDGVVGATKKRNKMLLCESCAQGNWSQVIDTRPSDVCPIALPPVLVVALQTSFVRNLALCPPLRVA